METHEVKIYFSNGDTISTKMNGSKKQIRQYYKKGKSFNLGVGSKDDITKVKKVRFLY